LHDDPYAFAKQFKHEGGKAVGVTPMYFPEEMAHGCGLLPVVLQESTEPITAGLSHVFPNFCAITHHFQESPCAGRALAARGFPRTALIGGIHEAIARRLSSLVRAVGAREPIAMTGGVAKNPGAVAALERTLGAKIRIPEEPQIVGALGAAVLALRGSASAVGAQNHKPAAAVQPSATGISAACPEPCDAGTREHD
jgi:BadF/BadG/BcrA/BcrD ATPase family